MAFWKKPKKQKERVAAAGGGAKRSGYGNRVAVEVKLLSVAGPGGEWLPR